MSSAVDLLPCPCTRFQQDESCPVGFPSALCGVCDGRGVASAEKVIALAAVVVRYASDRGMPEDPLSVLRAAPTPAMEAEPVAWTNTAQIEAAKQGTAAVLWGEVTETFDVPLYAHPQDAESLRGERETGERLRRTEMRLLDAERSYRLTRAERDAALARVAEVEADRRMIVSHATMGTTDGAGLSVNDISVKITALRNELYADAQRAALTPQPDAGLKALAFAYEAGALDVHWEWYRAHAAGEAPPREPDFREAADDYAASRSRPVGEVWQDIATAPKDGQTVMLHGLLHYPSIEAGCPETVLGHWTEHNGGGWVWHGSLAITFTHWRPLPVGPGDVRAALTEGEAG